MLRRLEIKNYALIESVELEFGSGFTAITGETGSGKSIMLGALSLLMGQRADSRTARGDKARVQAIFENVDPSLRQILTDKGIDWIESIDSDGIVRNELSIRREITSEGRSRVYINDTSVTLATLTEIGPRLIDIHSQSANSKIADNAEQLKMVDAYVANSVARENYRQAFAAFFEKMFGWTLVVDAKCIRLYKPKWYNEAITSANRDLFGFTRRDSCVGFLLLLEFFEREAREQGVTTEDRENLRFRFGDWLEYSAARFRQLFPDKEENYTDEKVRQILREIMPSLERYRFLRKIRPSADESVGEAETIYEALPALWHYQSNQLVEPVSGNGAKTEAE